MKKEITIQSGRKVLIIIAALVTSLLLSPVCFGTSVHAVELGTVNSLTVAPIASSSNYAEDAARANVVIDLYKLADAVSVSGSDAYTFSFDASYENITISDTRIAELNMESVSLSAQQWDSLAQQAMTIVLEQQKTPVFGTSVPTGVPMSDLAAGLYLIIAHGSDIADYVQDSTNDEGDTVQVTIAQSPDFTYSFAPALVALPTKASLTDSGQQHVVDAAEASDAWVYDAHVSLKPEMTPRYGGVKITKTIDRFSGEEEVTFVFRVTAEGSFPDDPDYSYANVAAVAFNAQTGLGSTAVLDGIRAGATVKVEEIYSGARYKAGALTAPPSLVIVAGEANEIVFTAENTEAGITPGHGIQNHFTYKDDENGSMWVNEQQTAGTGL